MPPHLAAPGMPPQQPAHSQQHSQQHRHSQQQQLSQQQQQQQAQPSASGQVSSMGGYCGSHMSGGGGAPGVSHGSAYAADSANGHHGAMHGSDPRRHDHEASERVCVWWWWWWGARPRGERVGVGVCGVCVGGG